jgi:hypothetical protein
MMNVFVVGFSIAVFILSGWVAPQVYAYQYEWKTMSTLYLDFKLIIL